MGGGVLDSSIRHTGATQGKELERREGRTGIRGKELERREGGPQGRNSCGSNFYLTGYGARGGHAPRTEDAVPKDQGVAARGTQGLSMQEG